jgi:hypothetical protein
VEKQKHLLQTYLDEAHYEGVFAIRGGRNSGMMGNELDGNVDSDLLQLRALPQAEISATRTQYWSSCRISEAELELRKSLLQLCSHVHGRRAEITGKKTLKKRNANGAKPEADESEGDQESDETTRIFEEKRDKCFGKFDEVKRLISELDLYRRLLLGVGLRPDATTKGVQTDKLPVEHFWLI